MSIIHLKRNKMLQEAGARLGRDGLSERVLSVLSEFEKGPRSYKAAMHMAGQMKAICQAAKADEYWFEQVSRGFELEFNELTRQPALSLLDEEKPPTP